ncbi:PIN domain-containing protein [candidate division KSB1 bacterium]|nr:PIN domain-containing protein [candidate division KSB1 bacterium]
MKKEISVIDACALIAFLNNESGAEKVQMEFQKAVTGETEIFMHVINLYEVYYDCWKVKGKVKAHEFLTEITNLPITIERRISNLLLSEAGYFKVNEKVSLADSIALGLAKIKKASVISSDHHEFDVLERKNLMKFCWIR